MLDVLIINSPLFRERNEAYDEDSLPPIGLGYIATILKNQGLKVQLIDAVAENLPITYLHKRIAELQPSFVAINIFTTNYTIVKDLVEGIQEKCGIIIGGLSTKELYKKIITWNTKNKVTIVTGDGEHITPAIIAGAVSEDPYQTSGNFTVYQVFTHSSYYLDEEKTSNLLLDRSFFKNEPVLHPFGFIEANIVTSRGCIYSCSFCAAARNKNKTYQPRERSIESVRGELIQIKELYPNVNSIRVLDDLFLKDLNSIERAIQTFEGLGLPWRAMAHVQTFRGVNDEVLARLHASGCNELFIGIESGSPKILKLIKKTADVDAIKQRMSSVLRAGINVKGYFIYGFPGETKKDMDMTFELATWLSNTAKTLNAGFRTSPFQFRPYHGTELYENLTAAGKFTDEINSVTLNHALSDQIKRLQFNFHSGNLSEVETEELYQYICRTAELNPKKLFENEQATGR